MNNGCKYWLTAVVIFLCILCHTAWASSPRADNMTLIEQNTRQAAQKLADCILHANDDSGIKFRRITVDSAATRALVSKEIRTAFAAKNLTASDSSDNLIRIIVEENAVLYDRPEGMKSDSVVRTIKTALSCSFNQKGNSREESVDVSIIDTVAVDEIPFLERGGNPAAHGILPKTKTKFWKRVLTPAIVVGSAILSVVLLFSVRSK